MTEEKRGPGAPTKYTPELAQRICDLVAGGMAFYKACAECGVTGRSGRNWLRQYPDFEKLYRDACEDRADDVVDSILSIIREIDTNAENATAEIQRVKLEVYAMQWIAGKMRPKKYNDKVIHTGPDGEGPVQVVIQKFTDGNSGA